MSNKNGRGDDRPRTFAKAFEQTLTTCLSDFQQGLAEVSEQRRKLKDQIGSANACAAFPATAPSALSELWNARNRLQSVCLEGTIVHLSAPSAVPLKAIADDWNGLLKAFVDVSSSLIGFAKEITIAGARGGDQATSLSAVKSRLLGGAKLSDKNPSNVFDTLDSPFENAKKLQQKIEQFGGGATLSIAQDILFVKEARDDLLLIVKQAVDSEAKFVALALRAAMATLLPPALSNLLTTISSNGAESVGNLYVFLLNTRNSALGAAQQLDKVAYQFFGDPPAGRCNKGWVEAVLLVGSDDATCTSNNDQLAKEEASAKDPAQFLPLLKLWQNGQAAPQKIVAAVDDFSTHGARVTLLRLLDVDGIRRDLEEQIRELVPFRKILTNSWTCR